MIFSMKNSYVMIHVIKYDMDPNSNINYRRKIGPMKEEQIQILTEITFLDRQTQMFNVLE